MDVHIAGRCYSVSAQNSGVGSPSSIVIAEEMANTVAVTSVSLALPSDRDRRGGSSSGLEVVASQTFRVDASTPASAAAICASCVSSATSDSGASNEKVEVKSALFARPSPWFPLLPVNVTTESGGSAALRASADACRRGEAGAGCDGNQATSSAVVVSYPAGAMDFSSYSRVDFNHKGRRHDDDDFAGLFD